jgi:hypothetical protein
MDIAQKKQAEIEILLKDALDLQEEIKEIAKLAAQVSEKFEDIGNIIQKSSKTVGSVAKQLVKATKFKGSSKEAGQLAEFGVNVIGEGVKAVGSWFAKRKEKKELEKLLPKKQELARAKKEVILRLSSRIAKDKTKITRFCQSEVSTIMDANDKKRYLLVAEGASKIFEAYFIIDQVGQLCNYLLDEFDAWLVGEHQSQSELKDATLIYFECVYELIDWSNLPAKSSGFELSNRLSVGGYLLLTDNQICNYSYKFDEIILLADSITNKKLLSTILPFSSKANAFKKYFAEYLKISAPLSEILKRKYMKMFWSILILSLLASIVFYFVIK